MVRLSGISLLALAALVSSSSVLRVDAFVVPTRIDVGAGAGAAAPPALSATADDDDGTTDTRRSFLTSASLTAFGLLSSAVEPSHAKVFFDPAAYGDQELRQSAVNSLKESVRRAILQDPPLAPSFYRLAILDGLSFDASSGEYGPDGRIVSAVLSSTVDDPNVKSLQKACNVLIESCKNLKRLSAIGIADAVALSGTAAVESVGGPFLTVQLGRTDAPKNSNPSPIDLRLLSGEAPSSSVTTAFKRSGLTEREMTAILGTLLTLETVQKTRSSDDWKRSSRPKFREAGKIGRASEFKPLTEQDIEDLENEDAVEGDDGWYIAESFGSRSEVFGQKVSGEDIDEKSFNKFLKDLYGNPSKKGSAGNPDKYGWIGRILMDKDSPTTQAWVAKYAGSYLNYNKDLTVAYNAVTQLGAEYTGGKYENLLKNRKRKTLNDDDLGIF